MKLNVHEIFPTIQGEGPFAGSPALFIRLAGCNVGRLMNAKQGPYAVCTSLDGTKFPCDTNYSPKEVLSVSEIMKELDGEPLAVITGGEPYLQQGIVELIEALQCSTEVQVETSGSRPINKRGEFVVCSPKHGYSAVNDHVIDAWKFVYVDESSEKTILDFVAAHVHYPDKTPIYIQPMVNHPSEVLSTGLYQEPIEFCMKHGFRLSVQTHKIIGMP